MEQVLPLANGPFWGEGSVEFVGEREGEEGRIPGHCLTDLFTL